VAGYFAFKMWRNKVANDQRIKGMGFWERYGHWVLWPLAFMLIVIGIALTFSILMVK
jgi:hypothetical protein